MPREDADTPMWPSVYARLETVTMTPAQLARAAASLRRAERLLDLLVASAARLKGLFAVAVLKPLQSGRKDLRPSQDAP